MNTYGYLPYLYTYLSLHINLYTMSSACYRIIWILINFIFWSYDILFWIRLRIVALILWSQDSCKTYQSRQQQEIAFLKDLKKRLSKIPKHLSLIIGNEYKGFSEEVVRRILNYAILMDIEYVSLYDTRRCHALTIENSIPQIHENLMSYKDVDIKSLDKHFTCCVARSLPHYGKNGVSRNCIEENGHSYHSQNQFVKVFNIQPLHGRHLLAHICRKLFTMRSNIEVKKIMLKRESISEYITKELKQNFSHLSEPELSIIFSNCMCTYGFLPWHARFTEFHRCEIGRRFDVQTFAEILNSYAQCHQRRGK